MITIFIEYKLKPLETDEYRRKLEQVQLQLEQYAVQSYQSFQAVDQEQLMVETFVIPSLEVYTTWKEQLQSNHHAFPWQPILPYIEGGKNKFNMWAFRSLR